MTVRRMRGASLGVAGALAAGLVLAPSSGATAGSDDQADPVFYPVSAQAAVSVAGDAQARAQASARRTAVGAAAKAATAKATQILQTWRGIQGAGQQGVSIAAGPSQVVQTVSDGSQGGIRAFVKATGVRPTGASKTLLQFFRLSNPVTVIQASVVYDPVGKRFIAVAVADNSGDVGLVMRISKGTAATPLTKKKWLKPVEFAFSTSTDEAAGTCGRRRVQAARRRDARTRSSSLRRRPTPTTPWWPTGSSSSRRRTTTTGTTPWVPGRPASTTPTTGRRRR